MFGQALSLVYSQLPDSSVLVTTVRTKTEQRLHSHPHPSSYAAQPGYALDNKLRDLSQNPNRAAAAGPFRVYPTAISGDKPYREERLREREDDGFSHKPFSEADLRYSSEKKPNTDENRPAERISRIGGAKRRLVAGNLNRRTSATSLTRMRVTPMIAATIRSTRRRIGTIAAKQKNPHEYSDEKEIPTRMVVLESLTPRYQALRTSRVVLVISVRTVANVARESAGVYFG